MAVSLVLAPAISLATDPPVAPAAVPPGCTGSATLGTFQLSVRPFSQGSPLPLKSVADVPAGSRLIWDPVHLKQPVSDSAEVTVVVLPVGEGELLVLEPRKARERTEWQLLQRPQVIALVYGPQGLSEGKVQALVTRNQDLLRQLADYADQSSQVESLVQELADAEQSRGGADNALKGVSAEYGVSAQRLSSATTSNQQAALLLKALVPASNSYDPLATSSNQVQQSGGVAASVAGLFFGGSPVGLAAGGAALFGNLKTMLFPNTEFRSAFAQNAPKDSLALCTKNQAPKSKTRTAYLWAYRVPQVSKPVPSLGTQRLPLGAKSTVTLKFGKGCNPKDLALARQWQLAPAAGGKPISVEVKTAATGALDIDLTDAKATAGDYQLAATWDWDPLPVTGTVHLQPFGDFTHVALAHGDHDKLVEGRGSVAVELTGADFEFLESVSITSSARDAKPVEVPFTLPLGKRAGVQNVVMVNIDTAKQGSYYFSLMQSDGVAHKVPVTILPPNPKIANLPVRLNVGETREAILLSGSGLDRVDAVLSDAGAIAGAPDSGNWSGEIQLKAGLKSGQTFALSLKVKGLENPLTLPDAIEIVGPRPKIRSLQKSLAGALGIEIGADELPAGTPAGLVLTVDHLHDATRPKLELDCQAGQLRQSLTLSPGGPSTGASLTSAGPGALYLSIDPGVVGYPGCRLSATVIVDPEGRSDPFVLGRVIRLPRLDKFTLTGEKVGDASYAGALEGHDLDVIEKVGWDATNGLPVDAIPTPLPPLPNDHDPSRQTLRLVLPWPAPGPHAPLYIWLRGESQGRKTAVAY
jgi:hypothetical protein